MRQKIRLRISGRDVDIELDEDQDADEELQAQVQQGTTANDAALDELRLAAEIRALDMNTYARRRPEFGLGKNVIDFLSRN